MYDNNAFDKYNAYDSKLWERIYFDENSGGYVVKHTGHKLDIENGKYELQTVIILANNGYAVEMMDESDFQKPQYDIKVDGTPSEIKMISGFRNIHRRAEKAATQGAKRIIYYINFDDEREMFKRFDNVYKTIQNIHEIWYIKEGGLHFFRQK